MGIAPLVAAVRRVPAHWKFGVPAQAGTAGPVLDGGTGDLIGLTVELYLKGLGWTDVSQWAQYRDGAAKIPIQRGRGDETSQTPPQTAMVVFNNRDGRFSPRNPTGPYYKLLTRNTPIRISRLNNAVRRYRFHGEVPSWPRNADISGKDVTTTVQAAGMLRRLSQGKKSAGSAMYRAYTTPASAAGLPLVAYWPCQDSVNSTSIASGLPGGQPMTLAGTPTFAGDSTFVCSDPLPLLKGSSWSGSVAAYTGGVDNVISFLLSVPSGGDTNSSVVCRVATAGTVARLEVQYTTANNGTLTLVGYNFSGSTLFTSSALTGINASPVRVQLYLQASGANVVWQITATSTNISNPGGQSFGTLSTASVGNVSAVYINPGRTLTGSVVGHVSVQYNIGTSLADTSPLLAWEFEVPDVADPVNFLTSRFLRLCTEQNVPAVVVSGPYDSAVAPTAGTMGMQPSDTFANLIQQPVDTSLGLLFEARDQLALVLRTRASLYNQAAKLTLDYSLNQLSQQLIPLDDDAYTRNDVMMQRVNGSSYTAQLATGAMSIQDAPNGAGDYQNTYSISLFDDTGLADHAGWRLHMGTVDEPRYPQVSLNLRHPTFTGSVDMMNAALTLDIGDRIVIKNPPQPDFPPDDISLIVQGINEVLGTFEHDMVLTCSPESPYRIGILEDPVLGHADTDGSTLAQAYPLGTETSLQVTTTGFATGSPLWTTNAGDFPFDINVGGERITVQNITGSGATQTFSPVVRSVNGVVKAQTSGTDVRLWQPLILSL